MARFIYNIATNITSVKVLSIDGPGALTNVQTMDFSSAMTTAGIKFGEFFNFLRLGRDS
jgi:hypothetical protein